MDEQRMQAHLAGANGKPTPVRPAAWRRMKRACVGHPWLSLAAVLSFSAPVLVAFAPFGSTSDSGAGTALDALPMPGAIRIHDEEAAPVPVASEPQSPPGAAPRMLEAGWDVAPPYPGGPAARHADFRGESDPADGVQTVGSNRPASARPRGAWLTGTIEPEDESPPGRPRRTARP